MTSEEDGSKIKSKKYLKLTLPVYWHKSKRKKILVNLNNWRNLHYQTLNKLKRDYHHLVHERLSKADYELSMNEFEVDMKYNYKNKNSDLDNMVIIIKFVIDALIQANIIKDDNVQWMKRLTIRVGEETKNANIEIIIKEI